MELRMQGVLAIVDAVISQPYTMRMDFILYCYRNSLRGKVFKDCSEENIIWDFQSVTRKLSKRQKGYTTEGVQNTITALLSTRLISFEPPKGFVLSDSISAIDILEVIL